MEEKDKYLEAARLIAECKPSKLPYVIAILQQGGFDLDKKAIEKAKGNIRDRQDWVLEYRNESDHANWAETDDKTVLALRKAYYDGVNFSKIASAAGVDRASVYKALYGKKKLTDFMRSKIEKGLNEICK